VFCAHQHLQDHLGLGGHDIKAWAALCCVACTPAGCKGLSEWWYGIWCGIAGSVVQPQMCERVIYGVAENYTIRSGIML